MDQASSPTNPYHNDHNEELKEIFGISGISVEELLNQVWDQAEWGVFNSDFYAFQLPPTSPEIENGEKRKERDYDESLPQPKQQKVEEKSVLRSEAYGPACSESTELLAPVTQLPIGFFPPPNPVNPVNLPNQPTKSKKRTGQISRIVIFGAINSTGNKKANSILYVPIEQYAVSKANKLGAQIDSSPREIGYSNKCGEKYVNSTLQCIIKPPAAVLEFLEHAEVTLHGPIDTGVLSLEPVGSLQFRIIYTPFQKTATCRRKPSNQLYTLTITYSGNGKFWQDNHKFYDAGHDHKRANK